MPSWFRWHHWLFLLALIAVCAWGSGPLARQEIHVDLTIPGRRFPDSGRVYGRVCSVFGDPVAGASVTLAQQHTVTDEAGAFFFDRIPLGNRLIRLDADGYQLMSRWVKIDAADNLLEFKYESGLFPATFAVDFHLYYTPASLEQGRCFGELALANGSSQNYYLLGLVIYSPFGVEILDLLRTSEDFRAITGTRSDTNFIAKPKPAVLVKPGEFFRVNLPPVPNPLPDAVYSLKCIFASQQQWDAGGATLMILETVCILDDDWNPHT